MYTEKNLVSSIRDLRIAAAMAQQSANIFKKAITQLEGNITVKIKTKKSTISEADLALASANLRKKIKYQ